MFPKKKIELFIDKPYKTFLESFRKKILGKHTFKLETLFDTRDFVYSGEYNFDHYVLERKQSIFWGIMIVPSAEIHIKEVNENKCKVEAVIKLSVVWKFFICMLYLLIVTLNLYYSISSGFPTANIILVKSIAGVVVLNLFIILTHYREVNLYKQLLKNQLIVI